MTDSKQLFAVIGDPIGHSLSPVMHNAAFRKLGINAEYIAVRVDPRDLEAFTKKARKELRGFNITVPHKHAVIPFLDEISETARLAGSVNTVSVTEEGKLSGDTTDGIGLELSLREELQFEPAGKRICFIGCGGVVPALAFHLAFRGAACIRILNRTLCKAESLCKSLQDRFPTLVCEAAPLENAARVKDFFKESDLAVQCTSVGLKDGDPSPVDPDCLPQEGLLLYDTIYKPTAFQRAGREKGLPVANGLTMLLYQGASSFRIWTGIEAPLEEMRRALISAIDSRKKA